MAAPASPAERWQTQTCYRTVRKEMPKRHKTVGEESWKTTIEKQARDHSALE